MFWCPEMFWGVCEFGAIGAVGKDCLMVREGAGHCVRGALQICCSRNLSCTGNESLSSSRRCRAAHGPAVENLDRWDELATAVEFR